jgi:hypothetical protein
MEEEHTSYNESFFFGLSVSPPGIFEFDMSDPDNVQVFKVYRLQDDRERLVGQYSLAVSHQKIAHLLVNPLTGRQTIRVFCRRSDYLSAAKYQIPVNQHTIIDFMQFNNLNFDYLYFRDEQSLNYTQLDDYRLVLNASSYAGIPLAEVLNRAYLVEMNATN